VHTSRSGKLAYEKAEARDDETEADTGKRRTKISEKGALVGELIGHVIAFVSASSA
jgi:hypothetical protein